MLSRFLGEKRTQAVLQQYANKHHFETIEKIPADASFVTHAEQLLAGMVGSASARVLVSSVAKEEPISIDEVMDILHETRQAIAYSHRLEKLTIELRAANERLQELDRLKDEFISTVTHELRTPLTSIRSLADILNENSGLSIEKHDAFTGIILKESQRLSRLITQVLDFQKIDSGMMEWQMGDVDLRLVVNDALNATRQLIEKKSIHLETAFASKLPIVSGDRDRLIQVMVNLISNAVKFCPESEGKITIAVAALEQALQVDVRDNGIGIEPQSQEIIFERFRQIRHSALGRPPGSGLGLAIVKSIIEHHGGRIWVESKPRQGATFSFTLPRDNPEGRL